MKIPRLPFTCLVLFALAVALAPSAYPTCGGGGGGGRGGAVPSMGGGGDSRPDVAYQVPWLLGVSDKPLPDATQVSLLVLWFPSSIEEARASGLQTSRVLTVAGERCVAPVLVTPDNAALHGNYKVAADQQALVLTSGDGKEIGRVSAKPGVRFDVHAAERLVQNEIDAREKTFAGLLKSAEKRAKAGDKSAVDDLQKVWAQRCLFPNLGKKAAKSLKKLGVEISQSDLEHLGADSLADADIHNLNADVEPLLRRGLAAELSGDYRIAEGFYRQAVELDPADTTALRYLGELYRHETGEWDKAGRVFNQILMQPADRIAQAVALHGLGKMTIHAGRYTAGLAYFEKSLAAYPLPITYRNLAVYWFSEKQEEKAVGYMRQALALDPTDTYNQIFAAVYLAEAGHKEEAANIARANESVLEASYNLAAIWAQVGDRGKAMEMLRRQFYTYERYPAVRSMEMKEARDDYQFASLHGDSDFIELTKLAKSAYLIGAEWCSPEQLAAQPTYAVPMPGAEQKG
jgi:tetratricopeptide (TPR) repeat protein